MTTEDKFKLKLKIIKEFQKYSFTLVEVFKIFEELQNDLSDLALKQELEKLKFKEKL